ncbi:uncharacterized protein LOC132749788 [Ruditapes philippinarum]|uniref:uncharacterized protein LOC132749788 n=1 Tax=Ruditapes philippinarum TaxID=129788 RepID=UPI00295BB61F|nr:uncharacterized protein LOC132749788 [Ruditapes philippinarum]
MKILTITRNGQQSQLQCDDELAKLILSKDTDPSLKEGLINGLLTNSQLESCRSQPSLENSKPQICYSQPQLVVNKLQSSNMQSLLHTSQPQIVYSRPHVDTNNFQPSNTQSVLHASQPQLGVNNLQSSNNNNQNQLSVRKSESISQSDSIIHTWKSNEEDLLVSLRHDKNDQFTQTKNHSLLWKAIAEEINKTLNCNITSTQAMNKYFSLKKKLEGSCRCRDRHRSKIFQTEK